MSILNESESHDEVICGPDKPRSIEETVREWLFFGTEKPMDDIKHYMTHKDHLIARTTNRVLSRGGADSEFVSIYHDRLTDADKEVIYDNAYDIGSPIKNEGLGPFKNVGFGPVKNEGLGGFYKYIAGKRGLDKSDNPIYSVNSMDYDLSKEIKDFIYEATGILFTEYEKRDRSLAYKVLGLFYLKCKEFPHLLTFLKGGRESQTNFEFRFTHPVNSTANQDLHEQSLKNTAQFSEILGLLTCQLPKEYLDQARRLYVTIPTFVDTLVKRLTQVARRHPNAAGQETISQISEMVFPKLGEPQFDRLDFKLFTALVLREYEVRMRSDKIIKNILREQPLTLRPFSEVNVSVMSEKEIITHLLGGLYVEIKDLDDKALFLEQIIRSYKPQTNFNRYRTAVIKALIIHDSELSITIPCQMHGAMNMPKSANSIFRNIKGRKVVNEQLDRSYFLNNGLEALLYFWETRANLACTAVQCDSVERGKEVFLNKDACEKVVDRKLIQYLKNANSSQVSLLPSILEAFSKNLLQYLAGSGYRLHYTVELEYAFVWKVG